MSESFSIYAWCERREHWLWVWSCYPSVEAAEAAIQEVVDSGVPESKRFKIRKFVTTEEDVKIVEVSKS